MPRDRNGGWALVIGGSAGALEPLKVILAALPPTFPGSVFVTIHTSAQGGVYLARVLSRATALEIADSRADRRIHPGRVYIAPPNVHLKIVDGHVELNRGVREHRMRPAIDVLFRSAARAHQSRVIAVVLSGNGADGASGAIAIRARGGKVFVQDPAEADAPLMPQRTIETAGADLIASAAEIGAQLARLMRTSSTREGVSAMSPDDEAAQATIRHDIQDQEDNKRDGHLSVLSCPDCGGVMWQMDDGPLTAFQCHIGHRLTPESVLVSKTEQLEAALVSALRLLKEKAIVLRQTAGKARERGETESAARFEEQAALDESHALLLQTSVLEAEPSSLSNFEVEEELARQKQ